MVVVHPNAISFDITNIISARNIPIENIRENSCIFFIKRIFENFFRKRKL